MRVVVYPHVLEVGGSQLVALDLAAAVRELGHDVIVFGQPGPLTTRIEELELDFVEAPSPRGRPSPQVIKALCEIVRERGVDLVHGYEWTAALEGYWGPRALLGVPAIATVMSMAVAPFLPRDMRLVVGTEQIGAWEQGLGRTELEVIEPPVDVRYNATEAVDPEAFQREYDLDPGALTVVLVSRLATELKIDGVMSAIEGVAEVNKTVPMQLVLVGDGEARPLVEERVRQVNAEAGRQIVVMTGELMDPRASWAAADICLAMGSSALRAMAFGRPVVIQGERGFWELVSPENERRFLWTGWYGVGDAIEEGPARLAAALHPLADAQTREELGAYSRRLVETRFSRDRAARLHVELYEEALDERPVRRRTWVAPGAVSAAGVASYRTRRRVQQLRGRYSPLDDFNATPVAKVAPPLPPAGHVWIAREPASNGYVPAAEGQASLR